MSKKLRYICENCGNTTVQWSGKCFECQSWNSFQEEKETSKNQSNKNERSGNNPKLIDEIIIKEDQRFLSGIAELDKVLGGGLVPGSIILIGGAPGVGKSTLLVELCGKIEKIKILYVSGEESESQVAQRFKRLGITSVNTNIYHETNLENIKSCLRELKPEVLILDSIQTTYSEEINSQPGSISQLRDVTIELVNYSKKNNVTSFIIGHVTKEGAIAGPRMLEHMVDTVVYFEGDDSSPLRMLRVIKNRFGGTDELGMLEMNAKGLSQVENPSKYFLGDNMKRDYGRALSCINEGNKVLFVELQVLVTDSTKGQGKRITQGFDSNRLAMLVAVLEKSFNLELSYNDIYLNVMGGMRLDKTDTDLCILAGLLSSVKNISIPVDTIFLGEVGLTGEVRPGMSTDRKLKEAEHLGFKNAIVPESYTTTCLSKMSLEILKIKKINDMVEIINKI